MLRMSFDLVATESEARAGVLHTAHGDVPTPAFMPVGTKGSVKGIDPDVLSGLGAFTSITLRMYAERKGWSLGTVTVRLKLFREETGIRIEREVALGAELDDDQRARIADICERTPVTLALKSGIAIRTTLK